MSLKFPPVFFRSFGHVKYEILLSPTTKFCVNRRIKKKRNKINFPLNQGMWTCVQVLADYWLLTTSFLPLLFTDYVISSSSSTDQTVRVIVSLPLLIGWCFFFHEFIYNLTTTSFFITSSHLLHITCSCFKHGVDCCFIFQKNGFIKK